MSNSFGNIKNQSLEDIVKESEFRKLWSITKDEIKTCRSCKFRYACPDCRVFIEEKEDLFSKPLKCGYDPYTGQWEDWNKNKFKVKYFEEAYAN